MTDVNELQELLVGAIQGVTRHFVESEGRIASVNAEAQTCDVDITGATFHDVPLKVLSNAEGVAGFTPASVRELPEKGSWCIIGFRDGNLQRPQLVATDKSTDFFVDSPQVTFHGGNLGGMVKAKELKTQSDKDRAILLALIQVLTGPPIPEPGNGQPSALQNALSLALAGNQPGTWDELENPKILQ